MGEFSNKNIYDLLQSIVTQNGEMKTEIRNINVSVANQSQTIGELGKEVTELREENSELKKNLLTISRVRSFFFLIYGIEEEDNEITKEQREIKTTYVKYPTCFALEPNERDTIPSLEAHTRPDTHGRSTAVVVVVKSVLEGIYGWSQDYVVSKRVPLVEDSIGEEMLSDGGSESFLKKLQAVAAESLVNVQEKDVAPIHGEGITEDSITLDGVYCGTPAGRDWALIS
ncbi:hypothetical protein JTB14_002090 [Gonioctena quinquepunctata]|nr:hypothetical protein JTB14_002090 [Gonioctena quinquepunctata]